MKERIEIIVDSFIDYAGKEHPFVIAAVSQVLPTLSTQLKNSPVEDERDVFYEISEYIDDYGCNNYFGTASKAVSLGISICHPTDTFDESVGSLRATARARKNTPILFAIDNEALNGEVIRALLRQKADYVKNNPENYIPGYADMKARYLTRKHMEELEKNFTPIEKEVISNLQKDPHFLENATKYLNWLQNQNKGNRVKNS
jgi:hypothetical protein